MVILLFGVTCVGKTTAGERLAEKLNYTYLDLDEEIRLVYNCTMEGFIKKFPFSYKRHIIKSDILLDLIEGYKDNMVIAVSPMFFQEHFDFLIKMPNVLAIELQDTAENIFNRLIFTDENDVIYEDYVEYREQHKDHYMAELNDDISFFENVYDIIEHKYFVDAKPIDVVAEELAEMVNKLMK